MMGVTVLGSTGSIGVSTLDVLARHPQRYRVVALTANSDVEGLAAQCREHRPTYAVMAEPAAAERLRKRLRDHGLDIEVRGGAEALEWAAALPEAETVMAAIVGAAGLRPSLAAARAGKRVLLANKEALVMAGPLFMHTVRDHGAVLLPIDSEHNALFQCMPGDYARGLREVGVRRILLTASGGPFRTRSEAELHDVTPDQACAHPNWSMGRKISVDSATMMNKGLEVIEAHWLFDAEPDRIAVIIHPQSVIHSMVEYDDGSVLAQMGNPDMRTPIAHALAWPQRMTSGVSSLDLCAVGRLDFEPADLQRFPCLRLAYEAVRAGGTAPAILNAANEVAVQHFLDGDLAFTEIAGVIERTLERVAVSPAETLDAVHEADRQARRHAHKLVAAPAREGRA